MTQRAQSADTAAAGLLASVRTLVTDDRGAAGVAKNGHKVWSRCVAKFGRGEEATRTESKDLPP